MNSLYKVPPTPYEQILDILMRPVACGYKNCDVIFGIQPINPNPGHAWERDGDGYSEIQRWEMMLAAHYDAAGHKQRRMREASVSEWEAYNNRELGRKGDSK